MPMVCIAWYPDNYQGVFLFREAWNIAVEADLEGRACRSSLFSAFGKYLERRRGARLGSLTRLLVFLKEKAVFPEKDRL